MEKRIAPNNNLPATHFIEVYSDGITTNQQDQINSPGWDCVEIIDLTKLELNLKQTEIEGILYTIAIFRIRKNKLPTLHNFNK